MESLNYFPPVLSICKGLWILHVNNSQMLLSSLLLNAEWFSKCGIWSGNLGGMLECRLSAGGGGGGESALWVKTLGSKSVHCQKNGARWGIQWPAQERTGTTTAILLFNICTSWNVSCNSLTGRGEAPAIMTHALSSFNLCASALIPGRISQFQQQQPPKSPGKPRQYLLGTIPSWASLPGCTARWPTVSILRQPRVNMLSSSYITTVTDLHWVLQTHWHLNTLLARSRAKVVSFQAEWDLNSRVQVGDTVTITGFLHCKVDDSLTSELVSVWTSWLSGS